MKRSYGKGKPMKKRPTAKGGKTFSNTKRPKSKALR